MQKVSPNKRQNRKNYETQFSNKPNAKGENGKKNSILKNNPKRRLELTRVKLSNPQSTS